MKLNLNKKNIIRKIEQMQSVLNEAEDESKKAKAQEELLLRQLNELFECESLDEGKELLDALMVEKDDLDSNLEAEADSLWSKMKEDGLI